MRIVGDYRYGSCVIDGTRYSVVKNYGAVERIRIIQSGGNPVIWQQGDPIDEKIIEIMNKADFRMPP